MAAPLSQGQGARTGLKVLTHDYMMQGMSTVHREKRKFIEAADHAVVLPALSELDAAMGESELLDSVAPIRLVSVGGSLAVCLFKNRESSADVDCILDPNIAAAPDYVAAFSEAVQRTSRQMDLPDDWLNRQVEVFVARNRVAHLFLESVAQGIVLYEGASLVVYAGRLDWALERKVRRVAHAQERRIRKNVDVGDAAAIIEFMTRRQDGKPLSFAFVRGLNENQFDVPPTDTALHQVASQYMAMYGTQGLVDLEWDEAEQKHKYRDLEGQWVWY